jgi:hypothetical protein
VVAGTLPHSPPSRHARSPPRLAEDAALLGTLMDTRRDWKVAYSFAFFGPALGFPRGVKDVRATLPCFVCIRIVVVQLWVSALYHFGRSASRFITVT